MKVRQLSKLICAGLISGAFLFGGVSEAGIVTDRVPIQCYADHQVNTYNSPGASKKAGYISANVDLIQITQIRGDGWCYGNYPGSGGKRVSRWFKITDVCADAGYTNRSANVKGKQTVYRTRNGGSTLGSVSNNERVIVVADNGSRAQIVYRLDNGTGYKLGWVPSSSVKAPAHAQQSHNPEGNFEGVSSPAANQIRVEGWAADRDNMGTSLRIHVYVGGGLGSGAESYEILANKSRTDVRSWFASQGIPAGEFYGFNNVIGVNRTGRQDIYVYAINVGGGDNIELGHKTVNIQSTQQPVAQEKAGYIKTNGANLNFRQTPNGTILEKLSNGTSITVLQHPATNGWSKIRCNGREGYVASQYVAIGNPPIPNIKDFPKSMYLAQIGSTTCTLSASAMMLKGKMYLNGDSKWNSLTENTIREVAWINGQGLKHSWSYGNYRIARGALSGVSINVLKNILNNHPEGIVLYCGKIPHAVWVNSYNGDTFYAGDPLKAYAGSKRLLSSTYLGKKYGNQQNILSNVTAYWYIQ